MKTTRTRTPPTTREHTTRLPAHDGRVSLERALFLRHSQRVFDARPLGLGSVVLGTLDDQRAARLLALPAWEEALLILPEGWPAKERGVSC